MLIKILPIELTRKLRRDGSWEHFWILDPKVCFVFQFAHLEAFFFHTHSQSEQTPYCKYNHKTNSTLHTTIMLLGFIGDRAMETRESKGVCKGTNPAKHTKRNERNCRRRQISSPSRHRPSRVQCCLLVGLLH